MPRQKLFSLTLAAAALLTLLTLPATACEGLLPETVLRQAIPDAGTVTQLSDVPERCLYQWAKPNQEARRASNDDKLRESMRRGSEAYRPQSLWSTLTVEIFATASTAAEARSLFNNYLSGRIPERYGSPDPLADTKLERLPGSNEQRQLAWNTQTRQLLLQAGNRLFLLSVDVDDDAKKNQTLALQVAEKLK